MLPGWIKTASAALLIAVLAGSFLRIPRRDAAEAESGKGGGGMRLTIDGMTCEHCAGSVRRALTESRGVETARVDLKKGEAVVTGGDLDVSLLIEAVESLGYKVTGTDDSRA